MRIAICLSILAALIACTTSVNAQYLWCEDADRIYAEVDGSTITVYHKATLYNCCPGGFEYGIDQQGFVIHVQEIEILPQCFCVCCFDLSVDIEDVAPGDCEIVFTWYDYETSEWQEQVVLVSVPDVGQGGALFVADILSSDCLATPTSSAPEPDGPGLQQTTWGTVKTLYR